MNNMESLKLSQKIFKVIGWCSLAKETKLTLKVWQIICVFFIVIPFIMVAWGSGLALLEELQMGFFGKNAFILIEVLAPSTILLSFISLVFRRKNIRDFCDKTQQIFNQCNLNFQLFLLLILHNNNNDDFSDENKAGFEFYSRADKLCELIIKWVTMSLAVSIIITMLFPVFGGAAFFYMRDGYVEAKNLFLSMHTKYAVSIIYCSLLELIPIVSNFNLTIEQNAV